MNSHAADAAALCGHLPLALEVVAGLVNENPLLSVPELLDRIRAKKVTLESVDAAFAMSCDLLGPARRRCWSLLSVFSGSFDLAAAAAVWGIGRPDSAPEPGGETSAAEDDEALDAMQALVKASLVESDATDKRFRLHDLARDFAARQMAAEDAYAVGLRHAEHFTRVAWRANELYLAGGEKVMQGLALFDRERRNLEDAFEFLSTSNRQSVEAGTSRHAVCQQVTQLVNAVAHLSSVRFHSRERFRWLEAHVAAASEIGDRRGEGYALGNLGIVHQECGEARKAIEFFEGQLAIVRELDDRGAEAYALGNLGNSYLALGEAPKAIELHSQVLGIVRELGDRRGEGSTLSSLGNAYSTLGNARRAIDFYNQALVIDRELGSRRGEAADLGSLGTGYSELGETRRAIDFHQQALVIDRELGDKRGESANLGNLGIAYFALGDTRKAIGFFEQQLVIAREIGDRRAEGNALGSLGIAHTHLGDARKAIEFFELQLAIVREIGDLHSEGNALGNLGIAHKELDETLEAIKFYDMQLALVRKIGDRRGEAYALGNLVSRN